LIPLSFNRSPVPLPGPATTQPTAQANSSPGTAASAVPPAGENQHTDPGPDRALNPAFPLDAVRTSLVRTGSAFSAPTIVFSRLPSAFQPYSLVASATISTAMPLQTPVRGPQTKTTRETATASTIKYLPFIATLLAQHCLVKSPKWSAQVSSKIAAQLTASAAGATLEHWYLDSINPAYWAQPGPSRVQAPAVNEPAQAATQPVTSKPVSRSEIGRGIAVFLPAVIAHTPQGRSLIAAMPGLRAAAAGSKDVLVKTAQTTTLVGSAATATTLQRTETQPEAAPPTQPG
jgi:hypothetical protein